MHEKCYFNCLHSHSETDGNRGDERRTLYVVILTLFMMVFEIVSGFFTGSMALLADGWHMGTHAFALGITYAAFVLARRHAGSGAFSFGTGKFGVLAGYTSSILLGAAAVWMAYESVLRLLNPVSIAFAEAIGVAVLGLLVNLASIAILGHDHEHGHGKHEHEHEHEHERHDHNYKSAYLHVIADALTSVFAIAALLSGYYFGWVFLDPLMGILGGLLICRWAWSLLKETAMILLDGSADEELTAEIRKRIESDGDSRVADLHVWHVGSHKMSAIISVISGRNLHAGDYRSRLDDVEDLVHLSIEIYQCDDPACRCRSETT